MSDPMFTIEVRFNEHSKPYPVTIFKDELFNYFVVMDNSHKLETIKFLITLMKDQSTKEDNDVIRIKLNEVKKMLDNN
jgi:2-keto-3-deoxy-L-rhamnonate aldolase RhmA